MSIVDEQFGSDANDGSKEHPFATLNHAISVAEPHDQITVFSMPALKSEYMIGRKSFDIKEKITAT